MGELGDMFLCGGRCFVKENTGGSLVPGINSRGKESSRTHQVFVLTGEAPRCRRYLHLLHPLTIVLSGRCTSPVSVSHRAERNKAAMISSISTQLAQVSNNENLLNGQTWERIPCTHPRNLTMPGTGVRTTTQYSRASAACCLPSLLDLSR